MTEEQITALNKIDNTVRKMLERLDCEVGEMLSNADAATIEALKAEPPFWVTLMNIDLDFHLDFPSDDVTFDFD